MPLNVEACKKLFKDYLLDDQIPIKVNLPRDLVVNIIEKYMALENSDAKEQKGWDQLIDLTWYSDKAYQMHLFSVHNHQLQCQAFKQEYEQWLASAAWVGEEKYRAALTPFSTTKELLEKAAVAQLAVTIAEDHSHFTPKAILMHNLALLKKYKAVVFIENLRKELQVEVENSLLQRRPTPLLNVYLNPNRRSMSKSRNPAYSAYYLIRFCIQEGIPIVGCESAISLDLTTRDRVQDPHKRYSVARFMQHYEHFKSLQYAQRVFPEYKWPLSLVGRAHVYTYGKKNPGVFNYYPSIVDLMGGFCIDAKDCDFRHKVLRGVFYEELRKLVPATFLKDYKIAIDLAFFERTKETLLDNLEGVLSWYSDEAGKAEYTEAQVKKIMEELYKKYSPPIKFSPAETSSRFTPLWLGKRRAGYLVQAYSPNVMNENPAKAAPVMRDFGAKLGSGLRRLGVFALPLASGKPQVQVLDDLFADSSKMPLRSLRFS